MGKRTKFLIRATISLGLLAFLFSQLDWEQARVMIARADLVYLPWPILVLVADRVWMAWKWRMLLDAIAPAPSLYEAVRVYYVSSFQGLALPLGGVGPDIVRFTYLRSSNLSARAVAASILLERIIGLLATVTIVVISALLLLGHVKGEIFGDVVGFVWVGLVLALLIAMPLFHIGLQRGLYRYLASTWFYTRFGRLQQFIGTMKKYQDHRGIVFGNYGLSVIEQLFPVVAFYFGCLMFHVPVTWLECLAVIPVSMFLQRLPISYAGIGVREGAQVLLFGALGAGYADILIVSTAVFMLFLVSLLPGVVWSFGNHRLQTAKPDPDLFPTSAANARNNLTMTESNLNEQ